MAGAEDLHGIAGAGDLKRVRNPQNGLLRARSRTLKGGQRANPRLRTGGSEARRGYQPGVCFSIRAIGRMGMVSWSTPLLWTVAEEPVPILYARLGYDLSEEHRPLVFGSRRRSTP